MYDTAISRKEKNDTADFIKIKTFSKDTVIASYRPRKSLFKFLP